MKHPDLYRIMGDYKNSCEEVDTTFDRYEAIRLQTKYQFAFGKDWKIWVEVQKFHQPSGGLIDCFPLDH